MLYRVFRYDIFSFAFFIFFIILFFQISPFPTDEELQENLQIRVNWLKYKKITLEKLRQTQQDGKPPKQTVKNRRLVFK
jgi:hypothetical protein